MGKVTLMIKKIDISKKKKNTMDTLDIPLPKNYHGYILQIHLKRIFFSEIPNKQKLLTKTFINISKILQYIKLSLKLFFSKLYYHYFVLRAL